MERPAVAQRKCRHGWFMYPPGDRYVGRTLELYGEYCEDEVKMFGQVMRPGAWAVEFGANIGALTVPLARMAGTEGRVLAFEPQRAVYNILCGNLALNGLMNVEALRAAGGAQAGQAQIPRVDYSAAGNFGGAALNTGDGPRDSVPVAALDSLNLPRLDFMKIDVEGFECEVLTGAEQTIRRLRPVLFVENDREEKSPALITALQGLGYRAYWHFAPLYRAENYNANPVNEMGNLMSVNLLCLPEERKTEVRNLRPVTGPEDFWKNAPSTSPSGD